MIIEWTETERIKNQETKCRQRVKRGKMASCSCSSSSSPLINNSSCSSSSYRYINPSSYRRLLPPYLLTGNSKRSLLSSTRCHASFLHHPLTAAVQGLNAPEAVTQAYRALQRLEVNLGLNPDDPIIPLLIVLGTSVTLWGSYWLFTSAGNAGNLTPQSTFDLLKGQEDVALIDIRPDDLRERDGIPDLRRAARSRYVSVAIPEVDVAVKKLLKRGKNLEDMLVAAVIRNLNVVRDRSKIIVMDADGAQSKGVVRSLKRLGIKKSYLLQGGFQSWIKDGLRIKELRPETAFQILNEEAEAIIEDFNPTPLKLLAYGLGLIAASYALKEWEKTLQLIGIIGIGQTVYRRLASYENAQDLKEDVRVVLGPVRVGGEAISWVAAKLEEANRNGLTTAPSSVDVQKRVLQAAAKHESQPIEEEEAAAAAGGNSSSGEASGGGGGLASSS